MSNNSYPGGFRLTMKTLEPDFDVMEKYERVEAI